MLIATMQAQALAAGVGSKRISYDDTSVTGGLLKVLWHLNCTYIVVYFRTVPQAGDTPPKLALTLEINP